VGDDHGYTQDEYCGMFLTLGVFSSRAGAVAQEYVLRYAGRRRPHSNGFPRLKHFLRKTESVTLKALVNAGRARTVRRVSNEAIKIVARQQLRSYRDIALELELSPKRVLKLLRDDQLHTDNYSRSAYLLHMTCSQ
jgi:hypothetical protein